jgi:hypothetical protein
MSNAITYEEFKAQWLNDISNDESLSAVEKGRRFALKLISQWLDFSDDEPEDVFYCDGAGDGGIDFAYLQRDDDPDEDAGHTWYVIQSKYGTAFVW